MKIVDIIDNVDGQGVGTTVKFEYEGQRLRYEVWFTPHGGGADFYRGDTDDPWMLYDDEREEAIQGYLDEVLNEYHAAYQRYVNPAIEQAVQFAIAASEAMLGEEKYDGLVAHTCNGSTSANDCPACAIARGEVLS